MNETSYIIDVTAENFDSAVLENSHRVPVLVDFWAPWCGPCQVLMPMLGKLADGYQGQFLLAKVNIDEQQELATRFGVRSVPTVKVVRHGSLVDEFVGAQPESEIRAIIERYMERESDRLLAAARAHIAAGEQEQAQALLDQGLQAEPHHSQLSVALAELLMTQDQHAAAAELLNALPADARIDPDVAALLGRLAFSETARDAPTLQSLEMHLAKQPDDSSARYQLAARKVGIGDFAGAMDQLLELMRRDRAYGEDAARRGLLQIFDMLGGQGELVNSYRSRMFNILH